MHYQIYREGYLRSYEKNLFIALRLLLAFISISTAAIILQFLPAGFSILNTFFCIFLIGTCVKLKNSVNEELLLKIDNEGFDYFSFEEDKVIRIQAEEISKITTGFCELKVHTRDNLIHKINMAPIKKEQTRWEVKEMVKQLARQPFSVAS